MSLRFSCLSTRLNTVFLLVPGQQLRGWVGNAGPVEREKPRRSDFSGVLVILREGGRLARRARTVSAKCLFRDFPRPQVVALRQVPDRGADGGFDKLPLAR